MKRTELKRTSTLKRGRLKPISDKKRAQKKDDAARVEAEGSAFHAAIKGERCVVCGRTNDEAWQATGYGHQAHHALPQRVLKRLGLRHLLWDPRNAVCCCTEPCHRRHTDGHAKIPYEALPARALVFCGQFGLLVELRREYA